ncbi:hypothetical protein GCM10010329_83910 [Streptomyces spiroverticillatus]|uniref:Integral membrane protein n=1 Tax=Streptomyces finlayi TaxID=67296 RepID=A0A919CGN8_9ACTN|nr:hypothetical protein GCM10010329_83910 [Streptomyces spiroverticillatus]GHD19097.1 hypothetical protein GCM10010334_82510 [Streptomyces finlayi]
MPPVPAAPDGRNPESLPPEASVPESAPPGTPEGIVAYLTAPALELLVHGVGGATPEEMLGDPRTTRVTGDSTAAVFRRTEDVDAEDRPRDYRDKPIPEAYVWSNLTSGNGIRALWLLLLPFMVVNLAHWMRPTTEGKARTVRLYGVLVRLVALTLTLLLVAAACEVALDLTAWQCAGSTSCSGKKSWLGFLSTAHGGWWSQPGRRIALAALVPVALTALLWYLSHRTWSAYESQQPLPNAEESSAGPALGRPGFWYGRRLVARLRAAHTAAGFLTVAGALTVATARYDRTADNTLLDVCGWALQGALLLGGAVVVWVVCRRGRTESRFDAALDKALVTLLPAASLVGLALAVLYAGWSRPAWTSTGRLDGGDRSFGLLTLAQLLLVLALAVVAVLLNRRTPVARTVMRGLGGPAVAMLACALGGVMSGGVAQRVADWLDGPGTPGMATGPDVPALGPPVLLTWQASVIPPILLVLLLVALHYGIRTWRVRSALRPRVEADYPKENPDPVRTGRIALARAAADLTDHAPRMVAVLSGVSLLLGGIALLGAFLYDEVPGRAAKGTPSPVEAVAHTSQALGSWLIGFGVLLLVTWGRRAYRDPKARRTIGILWDVGTFWPRAAHPFAPPCYAERAVPDLTWRMATWTERTQGRLVISGHSQGSVLSAAAVWQLPQRTRRRVALLTYGAPLERLYGRWFPAYFGPSCLRGLHDEVDCWRNLWRHTDPIGGPVRVVPDEDRHPVDRDALLDPLAYGRTPDHPLPAPILGHSDYQADPAFAAERDKLLARLPEPAVPRQNTPKD